MIVDGAATDHTVLTLSHWPHSGTPAELADDLSAQIVFRYLDRPDLKAGADIVSNNHIDEDGLVSVWAMVNPEEAQLRRDLLIDVAAAGDFGTYQDRRAARIAFAISTYADPDQSPLGSELATLEYPDLVVALFDELLPQLGAICDGIDARRTLWEAEDAILTESQAGIASGAVTIDEVRGLDLAVVTVPEHWERRRVHRFTQRRTEVIHPMAVHNATNCLRVLVVQGRRYRFYDRYESWVQYVTRKPMPRVDLTPLAARLSGLEREGNWHADGADYIAPVLRLRGAEESSVDLTSFRGELERHLADAPPAWDPY